MLAVTVGIAITVNTILEKHPCEFVNIILDVPADIPETNPEELTVATPASLEVHALVAAGVPEPESCVVDRAQTIVAPEIVGETSCAAILKTKLDPDVQLPLLAVTE